MAINISCEEALAVANFLIAQLKEEREEDKSALAAMTARAEKAEADKACLGLSLYETTIDRDRLQVKLEAVEKVLATARQTWIANNCSADEMRQRFVAELEAALKEVGRVDIRRRVVVASLENACDQFPCSALKNTCETCPDP